MDQKPGAFFRTWKDFFLFVGVGTTIGAILIDLAFKYIPGLTEFVYKLFYN